MEIFTKDLGLAAYIKMKEDMFELVSYDKQRGFIFKTKNNENPNLFKEIKMQYINSCCCKHDNNIRLLKNIFFSNGDNK